MAFALFLAATSYQATAQEKLAIAGYSPYSLYGFGDLVRPGTTYNLSMAGMGIGLRNEMVINILNPAAVTAREPKSFMLDFGIENRNTIYEGNAATAMGSEAEGPLKTANNTFTVHHMVVSFPIEKHSAFKVGIVPYSNVGYDFTSQEKDDELIAEVGDISYTKIGRGSIYQVFLGAAATFWNRLSVGVDGQYYFGDIERYSNASFNTRSYYRSLSTGWSYNVSSFGVKFGLQYSQPLDKGKSLTIGATYTPAFNLKGGETRYAFGETSTVTDTIAWRKSSISAFAVPAEIGAGITMKSNEKWLVGFDFVYQDWRNCVTYADTPGIDLTTGRALNFRLGGEWTPNRYDIRSFLKRFTYRAGVYHERSHLILNGSPVASTGLTIGVGVPVFRYYNSINVGLEIGQRGTLKNDIIRERYFLVNVSFNIHDIWFIKPLYN